MVDDDARKVVLGEFESRPAEPAFATFATSDAKVRTWQVSDQRQTNTERQRAPNIDDARLGGFTFGTIHSFLRH